MTHNHLVLGSSPSRPILRFYMENTLSHNHTFCLDSSCDELRVFSDSEMLLLLLQRGRQYRDPPLIMGYGSNVILPRHYSGLVLLNRIRGVDLVWQTDDQVCVSVGAGEVWHDFVKYALSQRWYGLENLALIPGSVGAAPVQNIGAYSVELSHFFDSCRVFCRESGKIVTLSAKDCQFGYRDSVFKQSMKGRFVILYVRLVLSKTPSPNYQYPRLAAFFNKSGLPVTSEAIFHAVCRIRNDRLPTIGTVGTVGSFFVNPIVSMAFFLQMKNRFSCRIDHFLMPDGRVKLFAGNLLTLAGWRGVSCGRFYLCHVNPIVLIHSGCGNADDLFVFVNQIQKSIDYLFGVVLQVEPEVVKG